MKAPLSLKARALQLLAQRDQSPLELRRKLLARARQMALRADSVALPDAGKADGAPSDEAVALATFADRASVVHDVPADPEVEVDAVLQWLDEKRFLSVERFAESRINARASRFGNLRIRHELAQHGAALSPEASRALVASELDRARAVHSRRFAGGPSDAKESARQARFLAARGFSADVIRRVLRDSTRDDEAAA